MYRSKTHWYREKIGFYGLLDMLYHLGRSTNNFENKKISVKNWFYKNPVSGGLWANVIMIFGISIVDNLRPTISH
jgi:hypothetical protein